MKLKTTTKYSLFTELLFTLVPILIVAIVRATDKDYQAIFYNTEWSIIALILFGQSIVKFSAGISKSNTNVRWQLVAFTISLIIIVGLIPTATILVINLTRSTQIFGLYLAQIFFFILSVICLFIPGAIGQKLLDE